jgi:hypothetical protein
MVRLIDQVKQGGANPNLFAGLVQACRYVGLLDASLAAHARARRLEELKGPPLDQLIGASSHTSDD